MYREARVVRRLHKHAKEGRREGVVPTANMARARFSFMTENKLAIRKSAHNLSPSHMYAYFEVHKLDTKKHRGTAINGVGGEAKNKTPWSSPAIDDAASEVRRCLALNDVAQQHLGSRVVLSSGDPEHVAER